jgi:agmatine deiminase
VLDQVLPVFLQIAASIARFQKVMVVLPSSADSTPLETMIPSDRLLIATCPSNDTWARDHGGITVLDESGNPVILDFFFNGWGLKFPANHDNLITRRLVDQRILPAPSITTGMTLEGGGIETNGAGVLMTTSSCLMSPNRNPHLSQQETEQRLRHWFGIEKILWLNHGYLAGDDTDSHIDTLARFCNEQTIAYVRCPDPTDEHFSALAAMEAELMQATDLHGRPFHLQPLPWPEAIYDDSGQRLPATYANFLLINDALLLPTYGVPQDAEALTLFETLFPNREIIGIPCRPLLLQHGSLHCVTMQYPAALNL